jgi:hypothetical protein
MWAAAAPLSVSEQQQRVLRAWVRAPSTPQGLVLRARIVLMASEGIANQMLTELYG